MELIQAITNCLLETTEKSLEQGKSPRMLEEQYSQKRRVKIV